MALHRLILGHKTFLKATMLESKVRDFFKCLEIPDEPTIYDYMKLLFPVHKNNYYEYDQVLSL